jgi:hypothetical protein
VYDFVVHPPWQPTTFSVKGYVPALVGVPASFREIGLLTGVIVIPAGNDPDMTVQVAGAQPLEVATVAEYAVLTVPLGNVVVVIVIFAHKDEAQRSSKGRKNFILRCCRSC